MRGFVVGAGEAREGTRRAVRSGTSRLGRGGGAALLALAALAAGPPLSASLAGQDVTPPGMVGPRMASRAELAGAIDSLRIVAASVSDAQLRTEVESQMAGLRTRLETGDVSAGDVVELTVAGEQRWTGEFTVTPRRSIELPGIEPVSLDGALYAEVEPRIAEHLGQYLREPRVDAEVLKRVAVLGAVGSPGFYDVRGSLLISDIVMEAGGPGARAKLDKVRLRRDGKPIGEELPRVAFRNLSLDELGVTSGDEVFVPAGSGVSAWRVGLTALGAVTSITFLVIRIF